VPTLNSTLTGELKSNPQIQNFTRKLYYVNSSYMGSVLSVNNNSFASTNIFNTSDMFFMASVRKFTTPLTAAPHNLTCYGLTYGFNSTDVCSIVEPAPSSPGIYRLVNTTEITPHYLISLYSLVNSSILINAHYNSAYLIGAIGLNETAFKWGSPYGNSCTFPNTNLSCAYSAFNTTSLEAKINLTNNLKVPVKLNRISCAQVVGLGSNQTINMTVAAGATSTVTMGCRNIPAAVLAMSDQYTLVLNYTESGAFQTVIGSLNVTR
jgi:hypothetical protein